MAGKIPALLIRTQYTSGWPPLPRHTPHGTAGVKSLAIWHIISSIIFSRTWRVTFSPRSFQVKQLSHPQVKIVRFSLERFSV